MRGDRAGPRTRSGYLTPVRSAAAGVVSAVTARVARAGADLAATALGAFLGVFPGVEQRLLAGRLDGHDGARLRGLGRGDEVAVHRAVGERLRLAGHALKAGPHLGGHDAELGLRLRVEELLAEPPEDVVDERLGDADVRVVREAGRLEAHVAELRDVDVERDGVLPPQRARDYERVHEPC